MTAQRVVLGAWIATIGLATVRAIAGPNKGLPPPSAYLGSGVLFTLLYGASSFLGPLPAVIAVGVPLGAALTPYLHGQPGPLDQLATWLDGIAGTQPASGSSSGAGSFGPAPQGRMAA